MCVHMCTCACTSTINGLCNSRDVRFPSRRTDLTYSRLHPRLASHRRREQDYLRVYTYIHTYNHLILPSPTDSLHTYIQAPPMITERRPNPQHPARPSALTLHPPPTRPQSSKKDPKKHESPPNRRKEEKMKYVNRTPRSSASRAPTVPAANVLGALRSRGECESGCEHHV